MEFNSNTLTSNSNELLKAIEHNHKKSLILKDSVIKLKGVSNVKLPLTCEEVAVTDNCEEDYQDITFAEKNDDIDYYLELFHGLNRNFTKEELLEILPDIDDYRFKNVVLRLLAETIKEMKELHEIINEEKENLNFDELVYLEEALKTEKKKNKFLEGLYTIDKAVNEEDLLCTNNKLILMPTKTGSIKFIDEITSMPTEYFQSFLELINSIVDGSFKNFRRFVSNDLLTGMCEVKGFKTRVIFSRIGRDSYALVSAIIKKDDNSTGYRDHLTTRVSEFRTIENSLKELLNDEKFMVENDFYVQELYNILKNKDKSKKYKKYKRDGFND